MSEEFPLGPELLNIPIERLETAFAGKTAPEGIRMYLSIIKGERMGPGEGWFGPSQSTYSWAWLAKRCGINDAEASIARDQFPGPDEWFCRLDRNRDGRIQPSDLDWADGNPWVVHAGLITRLFRQMNNTGDGRMTRERWHAFFEEAAEGHDSVSLSQLRNRWLSGIGDMFLPGDAPTEEMLVMGLFSGELGSLQEGPAFGAKAPEFNLKSADGTSTIRLSDHLGRKPILLVFGNFTCPPFRALSQEVDEIARRYRDQVTTLGVYIREAHPTDGWKMQSNERVGVCIAQPTSLTERTAVATQCFAMITPSFPWGIDDVDDATGHAYSGMPARLYILSPEGTVLYKGGRGPFGFKPGEMEQALIMTLLDRLARYPGG